MFILSQDRKTIYNLDNYRRIDVVESAKSFNIYGVSRNMSEITRGTEFGIYTTEDRAKGIIQDILRRADVGARTFIMPEE